MRHLLLVSSLAFLATHGAAFALTTCVGGRLGEPASFSGEPDPTIANLVASIPGSSNAVNPTLAAMLVTALKSDPELASDAVDFARTATAAQKDAIAAALAVANAYFAANDEPTAESQISAALRCADRPTQVAYDFDRRQVQAAELREDRGGGRSTASAFIPSLLSSAFGGGPVSPN